MVRLHIAKREDQRSPAAEQLMAVALRLFAERGVDGVTVREIATTAGQKNHGAVGYYFGSKEALVRELVLDGAIEIDRRRNADLDRLEGQGGPRRVRDLVDILIFPATDAGSDHYIRFVVMLSMTHRDLMMDALQNRWNSGYLRCLEHLRGLMPPMSRAMQNQRFVFLGGYLGGVLARREQALADHSRSHPMWGSDAALEDFARLVTLMLESPAVASDAPAHDLLEIGPVG